MGNETILSQIGMSHFVFLSIACDKLYGLQAASSMASRFRNAFDRK